jgi:hypothetical protein
MSTHKETRLVHCYDPVAFVIAVEQGVKDGFSLDLVTPEHYPQQIGFQFICTMVKDAEQEVKKPQKEVLTVKIDASEVQAVVDKAVEEVKTLVEASELEKVVQSTQEELKAAVEAPKKAAGRPAKGK